MYSRRKARVARAVVLCGWLVGCAHEDEPELARDPSSVADEDDDAPAPARDAGRPDTKSKLRDAAGDVAASDAATGDGPSGARADASSDDVPPEATDHERDGGVDEAGPPRNESLCRLAGNEVAVLGDSYVHLSGDFTNMLELHARGVGALGRNDSYVDRALSGASMNGVPNIPSQFGAAVADAERRRSDGIKLVIMTGGGNDVLINQRSCLDKATPEDAAEDPICVEVVDDLLSSAQGLYDDMIEHGVQASIYFFYPHLPRNAPLGPLLQGPKPNSMLDYVYPRVRAFCEGQTRAPCYFVDLRPVFDDPAHPGWPRDGLIGFDGVHPMAAGSQLIADEVWKVMQTNCLGVK